MSSHLRAEDHPTTRVIPEPSQRSRAGRLPPPRGDPAAEHYSHPIFWREPLKGAFRRCAPCTVSRAMSGPRLVWGREQRAAGCMQ